MTALETALRQICGDLFEAGHSFALVGGLAVSARTEPRFTRDADIVVAVASDAEAEALVRLLRGRSYEIEALVEQEDDVTRPQDVADLRALLRIASAADVERARAALTLIAQRGYDRGRDLEAELEELLRT